MTIFAKNLLSLSVMALLVGSMGFAATTTSPTSGSGSGAPSGIKPHPPKPTKPNPAPTPTPQPTPIPTAQKENILFEIIDQILNATDLSKAFCTTNFHIQFSSQPAPATSSSGDLSQSSGSSGATQVKIDILNLNVACPMKFTKDIVVNLLPQGTTETANESSPTATAPTQNPVDDLIPKAVLVTTNLWAIPKVEIVNNSGKILLNFCSGFVAGTGACIQKPMKLTLKNNQTAGFIYINLYSLLLEFDGDKKIQTKTAFKGSCIAEQKIFDFKTLQEKLVKPTCEFDGYTDSANKQKPFQYTFTFVANDI